MKSKANIFLLIILSFFISSIGAEKILDAPTCEITAPLDGDDFDFGDSLEITVNASDDGSIVSVSFYVDGVLQDIDYHSPYVYKWHTLRNTIGDRLISAVAMDNKGLSGTDNITIQVALNGVNTFPYKVIIAYTHDNGAFTQGLVYEDDSLYEGTGLNGQSSLRRVVLETG